MQVPDPILQRCLHRYRCFHLSPKSDPIRLLLADNVLLIPFRISNELLLSCHLASPASANKKDPTQTEPIRRTEGAIFFSQANNSGSRSVRVFNPQTRSRESNFPFTSRKCPLAEKVRSPSSPLTSKTFLVVRISTSYICRFESRLAAPKTLIGPTKSSSSTGGTTITTIRMFVFVPQSRGDFTIWREVTAFCRLLQPPTSKIFNMNETPQQYASRILGKLGTTDPIDILESTTGKLEALVARLKTSRSNKYHRKHGPQRNSCASC